MGKTKQNKTKEIVINSPQHTRLYDQQIMEYANQSLNPDELNVYKEIYTAIATDNKLDKPQDMLLLDVATFDYLRIKRLQRRVTNDGEVMTIQTRTGPITIANPAANLLNAVNTSFRNSLKELGITGKERLKTKLGINAQDFATFMSDEQEAEIVNNGSAEVKD